MRPCAVHTACYCMIMSQAEKDNAALDAEMSESDREYWEQAGKDEEAKG